MFKIIKYAYIDFEFNRAAEKYVNLVCCSIQFGNEEPKEFWLHNSPRSQKALKAYLRQLRDSGVIMVAYGAAAECRAFMALSEDPHDYQWVDLYSEWRQLTYNNDDCQYGTYFDSMGGKHRSVAPHLNPALNKGKDNRPIGMSYAAVVGRLLGVNIDTRHKTKMRDLVLQNLSVYAYEEREAIQKYNTSDIQYLSEIRKSIMGKLKHVLECSSADIRKYQLQRGAFIASIAKMETVGFPVLRNKILNLRLNYQHAENEIIENLVTKHYPFFVKSKRTTHDVFGKWTDKYSQFVAFLAENNLLEEWPKTESGQYSKDDKVLKSYGHYPAIKAYDEAKKNLRHVGWFRLRKGKEDFFDSVGTDDKLRAFLGPFGTQTGRNAPPASRFILAMSSWLRCLVMPPKGYVIIAIDYASQEFAIAAVLSDDFNMVKAYKSGDPYLYFAKAAGAVPWDAEPGHCKKIPICDGIGKYTREQYKKYKQQRGVFKSTTLGLQYGMGAKNLAIKLTTDTGIPHSETDANRLIDLHKETYPEYWDWLYEQIHDYEQDGYLKLKDGWALLKDNINTLSIKNFPTQGTGAAIMRNAVLKAHKIGLDILAPLHDAIYCIAEEDKAEYTVDQLSNCMTKAAEDLIGTKLKIRLDVDIHPHGIPWVDGKGVKNYEELNKYLEYIPDVKKEVNELLLI